MNLSMITWSKLKGLGSNKFPTIFVLYLLSMLVSAARASHPAPKFRLVCRPSPLLARFSSFRSPTFQFATVSRSAVLRSPVRAMSSHKGGESTIRPAADKVLQDIADYVHHYRVESDLAFETARLCLIDTIGCGLEALRFPECTKLLGPVVEGTIVPNGTTFHSATTIGRLTFWQELVYLELITNLIQFVVPLTLVQPSDGLTLMIVFWLLSVRIHVYYGARLLINDYTRGSSIR